jgi:hypothetical protein
MSDLDVRQIPASLARSMAEKHHYMHRKREAPVK